MKYIKQFRLVTFGLFLLLFLSFHTSLFAQTETPTPTSGATPTPDTSKQQEELSNKIKDLENKVSDLQGQEKTLSSQISVMDNQISLTEARIASTQSSIRGLTSDIAVATKKIGTLEKSLDELSKVLIKRVVTSYQLGQASPLELMFSSKSPSHFLTQENYRKVVQEHDRDLIIQTEQAKNDYTNQQKIFETKKEKALALQEQLTSYNDQLASEQEAKKRLLAETQGSESNYQRLLSQAKAQLAGFSRFTASQGGASILGNQTVCNDWGCYYNQRDGAWGGTALNHTEYTLASDGCLVTSVAMVLRHYGAQVTPADVNNNPSNFASYYPAYLNFTASAGGKTLQRTRIASSADAGAIDGELSQGRPVIVGISHDSGPMSDHFLVLVSGSGGNYKMHDPFTEGGNDMPFTDKYSLGSIRDVYRATVN